MLSAQPKRARKEKIRRKRQKTTIVSAKYCNTLILDFSLEKLF